MQNGEWHRTVDAVRLSRHKRRIFVLILSCTGHTLHLYRPAKLMTPTEFQIQDALGDCVRAQRRRRIVVHHMTHLKLHFPSICRATVLHCCQPATDHRHDRCC